MAVNRLNFSRKRTQRSKSLRLDLPTQLGQKLTRWMRRDGELEACKARLQSIKEETRMEVEKRLTTDSVANWCERKTRLRRCVMAHFSGAWLTLLCR